MDRRAALLFAALGVTWGIPYLLVKIAVVELSPAALVLIRTAAAAALLLPIAAAKGQLRPMLRYWPIIVIYAVVEVVVPWLMIGHAEQRLASSTTGLLIAATPLVGVALGLLTRRHEPLGAAGWAGLALGLAGVAALVGLDIDTSDHVAVLQLSLTVVGYAVGPMMLVRYLSDEPGIAVVGTSFAVAAIASVGVLAVDGGWPTQVPSPQVLAALVVLVLVCTVGGFLMLFSLVGMVGAVRSTAITYVNPAVAIIVGAIFLGEPITTWTLVGFVLVLAGSVLLTRRPAVTPQSGGAEDPAETERERATLGDPALGTVVLPEFAHASAATHSPLGELGRRGGVVSERRRVQRDVGRRVGRPVLARRR